MTADARIDVRQAVRDAWATHLGRTAFADDDDFFSLGGDSLLAARVMARLSKTVGQRLKVGLLLRNPTVDALTAAVEQTAVAADGRAESR